jgi:hypothetical protein
MVLAFVYFLEVHKYMKQPYRVPSVLCRVGGNDYTEGRAFWLTFKFRI